MKILVAGLPKSGTTALMYNIMQSVQGPCARMFEPVDAEHIYHHANVPRNVIDSSSLVAKILCTAPNANQHNIARIPDVRYNTFQHYDKKIFIVRDPRDNLVSLMLYMIVNTTRLILPERAAEFIELLQRKQKAPEHISLIDILNWMSDANQCDFIDVFTQWLNFSVDFHDRYPGYRLFSYSDLITNNFRSLEQYLGFAIACEAEVEPIFSRVVRTKGSGDWRNWFNTLDVEYFRPVYADYMRRYDYLDDWSLPERPRIDPAHGSEYVRRIVNEYYKGMKMEARV